MARSFTTSTDAVRNSSFPAVASVGAIGCWVQPNWNSGTTRYYLWNFGNSGDQPSFQQYTDGNLYVGFGSRVIVASTGFVSGTWGYWLYQWNNGANTEALYNNNTLIGSSSSGIGFGTGTGYNLGNSATFAGLNPLNGQQCELTYWSGINLTTNEIAALVTGARSTRIRSASIALYVPMFGLQSPEPDLSGNAYAGTVTGTALANHAPITPFTPKNVTPGYVPPASAATTTWGYDNSFPHRASNDGVVLVPY